MDSLEDLFFCKPHRDSAHHRILSVSLDTLIRNLRRERKKYNVAEPIVITYYDFVKSDEVLRLLPFFWFTNIKIVFCRNKRGDKEKTENDEKEKYKQVIYEVYENRLETKYRMDKYGRKGPKSYMRASDFEQEIPFDRAKYPDLMYSADADDLQKIQERYGNPFQFSDDKEINPLQRGIQRIKRKGYKVIGIDAYLVRMSRRNATLLLRLHWNSEEQRFLRVEGNNGLLERYDYGAREYMDRVFGVKRGNSCKRSFEDIVRIHGQSLHEE